MIESKAQKPQQLLAWMEGLSDPTRVRLLRLLEQHELGVVELCEILQLPQSTVSRHLKVLSDQEWVRSRRDGTTRLYRMILDELTTPARKLWLLAREQTANWATLKQDELRLVRRLRERDAGDAQTFFAGAAAEWDRLRRELYGDAFTTEAMLALLPSDLVVADLGCGTGQIAVSLAPHVKQVIAVDNSPAMLKAAKKNAGEFENVDLRRGELTSLPIEDAACDAALIVLVLSYLPEPVAALREASRILKSDGRLVIVDLLPHDRDDFRRRMGQKSAGIETSALEAMLNDIGFSEARFSPLPPAPAAKGPALFRAVAKKTRDVAARNTTA